MSDKKTKGLDIDSLSGVETTGHSWDGIKELNNPLPRWWLYTFYATIVWSLAYVVVYPAIPLLSDNTKGTFGWSSRGELTKEIEAVEDTRKIYYKQIADKSFEDILADEKLRRFAISAGNAAFKINCIQCHGSGASGSPGYPNLNDDDWIWGGKVADIYTTIKHGVRYGGDEDSRISDMPRFGADELLEPKQITMIASYILELSGKGEKGVHAEEGATLYAENCASCHGNNAQGMRELGAPNLIDAISLYGGTKKDIIAQIKNPKHGVMPGWYARLSDATIKELAIYVHSLGGGE